ncbi:protein lethal(2)k10201 [Drosophila guanche]|uniref:Blast:Protein lethal(2)k10201 n=1 Tax=Drosophila guanche TaxID=7266 RepID=A0A3B0JK15_DROGU|nr:protein lethal(2)k10201 [Drosophila guanche]SPP72961.1 blast:Protein lethal(2)k10201 [Drosophila guanche]
MDTQLASSPSPYLLTKEQILQMLSEVPAGFMKPTVPPSPAPPPFKKLGVLVDADDIIDAKEATSNRSSNNNNYINSTQSYLCAECRRTLPTAHLLDLHIAEQHDFYFAASVERGDKPMFACYLEECGSKFHTPRQRKDHCITAHKFPVNYRFDQDHGHGKTKHKKNDESSMEVDELPAAGRKGVPYIKAFCFGHNTMRTFNTRKERQSGDTLEDVQDMKNALEDILD